MVAHDFRYVTESLTVVVDGGWPQTIDISANCASAADCATVLNIMFSGASVAASGTSLVITSASIGGSSSVAIIPTGSGSNALALFGTPTIVAGTANSGENLIVVVDGGTAETIALSTDLTVIADAVTRLNAAITGATVVKVGDTIKITSDTPGASSSVAITSTGSGTNALELFDLPAIASTVVGGTASPTITPANFTLSTEACDVPFESVLEICKRARGKFAHTCEFGWAEQVAKDSVDAEEAHRLLEASNRLPSETHCSWLSAHRAASERHAFLENSNQVGSSSYPSSYSSSSGNYGSSSYLTSN